MIDLNASTAALDAVEGPTEADLLAEQAESVEDWEALLNDIEPVVKISKESAEDFWNEDENVHDDRWDSGIPKWSAWA